MLWERVGDTLRDTSCQCCSLTLAHRPREFRFPSFFLFFSRRRSHANTNIEKSRNQSVFWRIRKQTVCGVYKKRCHRRSHVCEKRAQSFSWRVFSLSYSEPNNADWHYELRDTKSQREKRANASTFFAAISDSSKSHGVFITPTGNCFPRLYPSVPLTSFPLSLYPIRVQLVNERASSCTQLQRQSSAIRCYKHLHFHRRRVWMHANFAIRERVFGSVWKLTPLWY